MASQSWGKAFRKERPTYSISTSFLSLSSFPLRLEFIQSFKNTLGLMIQYVYKLHKNKFRVRVTIYKYQLLQASPYQSYKNKRIWISQQCRHARQPRRLPSRAADSSLTTSTCLFSKAWYIDIHPSASADSTSAPFSSSSWMTSTCQFWEVCCIRWYILQLIIKQIMK